MLNLSKPVTFHELGNLGPADLLDQIKAYCSGKGGMHQESLKAVVLKLTYLSRDLSIKQAERDEAADMATHLANAALKTYGQRSDFGRELVAGVQAIVGQMR